MSANIVRTASALLFAFFQGGTGPESWSSLDVGVAEKTDTSFDSFCEDCDDSSV